MRKRTEAPVTRSTARSCRLLIACGILSVIPKVGAEEFSTVSNSSVIGQNYGYPTGLGPAEDAPVGGMELLVETAFFAKNLELTGFPEATGINGETFIGFLMPTRARYRAYADLDIELGGLFGQNFGDDDSLDVVEPLARLVYEPQDNLFLIAGTILPTHWSHDALLDDVQRFRANTEQGFQWRVDRERHKQDTWINWRIRESDNRAEEFEVGSTTQLRFLDGALWVDGQLFWAHVGGQKNSTNRVENNRILAGGASYGWRGFSQEQCIEEIRIGVHYFNSHDGLAGATTGDGVELSARVDTTPAPNLLLRGFGSHFSGSSFSSWRGDPLYQFDEYQQIGGVALYTPPKRDFSLEASIVGQQAESRFNYTILVNFIWGQACQFQPLVPR